MTERHHLQSVTTKDSRPWERDFQSFRFQTRQWLAVANEDTLLPTQMFPRLPSRATFVADTNFVFGTQKMFLFRNILCPQQMGSCSEPTNVSQFARARKRHEQQCLSATMFPRLPPPLGTAIMIKRSSWQVCLRSD